MDPFALEEGERGLERVHEMTRQEANRDPDREGEHRDGGQPRCLDQHPYTEFDVEPRENGFADVLRGPDGTAPGEKEAETGDERAGR